MAYESGGETKADRKWGKWLAKCEQLVGRSLQHIDAHSDLWDLYSDGCTPSEAVDEMLARGLDPV